MLRLYKLGTPTKFARLFVAGEFIESNLENRNYGTR